MSGDHEISYITNSSDDATCLQSLGPEGTLRLRSGTNWFKQALGDKYPADPSAAGTYIFKQLDGDWFILHWVVLNEQVRKLPAN